MSLSDLPDDILGLISFWLNGFDNCSLWMASDSKLKQRLVNNVITDFDIKYTVPGRYLWPGNFLKKLQRLSRLSLVVDKDVDYLPIHSIEFFRIETLKYLKIERSDSHKILHQTFSSETDNATGPTTSSTNDYINLNNLFPNLEYFGFSFLSSSADVSFTIDFLRFLPQNLKTLEMPDTFLRINQYYPDPDMSMNIGLLPRTLTALNLSIGTHKYSFDASKLPPNLTSLITNARIEERSYSMIPKNLKVLQLIYTEYDIPKMAPYLPTGLQSLSVQSRSMIGESLSHLQYLECIETYCSAEGDQMFAEKYPPNLKRFRGYFDGPQKLQILPFPHGLVELSLDKIKPLDHDFFVALPQTVTHLSLYCREYPQKLKFLSLLPKNLRYLDTDLPIKESISSLPHSMTYLRSICRHSSKISEIDQLPPKLETFINRGGIPVSQSLLKNLPSMITWLDIFSTKVIIDDDIIRLLPRGLKTLLLNTQDEITDASAGDFPPNMTKISLMNNVYMTDDGIVLLSRSLKFLILPKNPNFTDKCIKHLPRSLIELALDAATKITSQSCKDLPKYLRVLRLPNCAEWDLDIIPVLPPYLYFVDAETERSKTHGRKF